MAAVTSMTSMTSETSSSSETLRDSARATERKTIASRPSRPRPCRGCRRRGRARPRSPIFGDGSRPAAREPTLDEIRVVGLDAEWRPQTEVPSRCCSWRRATARSSSTRWRWRRSAADEIAGLGALSGFQYPTRRTQNRFGFAHDLARLRRSYPRLAATRDVTPTAWWTLAPSPSSRFRRSVNWRNRGSPWSWRRCSARTWIRRNSARTVRPLTRALAYAAADAHCLTVVFDRCACAAPDAIAAALADPDPNLLAEPPASAGGESRGHAAKTKTKTTKTIDRPPSGLPMTPADVVASVGRSFDGRSRRRRVDRRRRGPPGGGRGGAETAASSWCCT